MTRATPKPPDLPRSQDRDALDTLPDARDGLTRIERVILIELERAQRELGERNVPSALLYGRVAERVAISTQEFQRVLSALVGRSKR